MTKSKPTNHLREIKILYKRKKVKKKFDKQPKGAKGFYELFSDLQFETKERMISVNLDCQLKIICFEVIAIGVVDALYVRPFEALRSAIAVNASGFVLLHNHPSGNVTPSPPDKRFTSKVHEVSKLGGLKLWDHIIIGDERYFSFQENGLLHTQK